MVGSPDLGGLRKEGSVNGITEQVMKHFDTRDKEFQNVVEILRFEIGDAVGDLIGLIQPLYDAGYDAGHGDGYDVGYESGYGDAEEALY